jgi:peptidoglycan/LPS O-acetylase OafA/YrhL
VIGLKQYRRVVHLALDAGGAQLRQAFDVVVARNQPVEAFGEAHEAGRAVQAVEAANAHAGGGWTWQAGDLAHPPGDGVLETALTIDQLALEGGAGSGIVEQPEAVRVVLEAEDGDPQKVVEAVVVPQQRPYPRKQPEDDPGSSMAGSIAEAGGGGENSRVTPGVYVVRTLELRERFFAKAVWIRPVSGGFLAKRWVPRQVAGKPDTGYITGGHARVSTRQKIQGPTGVTASTASASKAAHAAAGVVSTDNSFNALRLIFALMVAAFHAVALPSLAAGTPLEGVLAVMAEVGVQGFFVLSGYLVYASLQRSSSLGLYAEKRVRRLYPGYATVVIVCALAALALSPEARANLGAVAAYLGWNLLFLNFMAPEIPGVFEAHRFSEINGALWTLKIEVLFYLILPLLAAMLRIADRWKWLVLALIYVAAEAWRIGFREVGNAQGSALFIELFPQLPGQMSFFVTGMAFHLIKLDARRLQLAGLAGLGLFVLSLLTPLAEPLRAVGLGALTIYLGTSVARTFDAARFGDLSYGLYIVHFPIIQTVIAAGLFASVESGVLISAVASLAAALVLWHLVERPALRADSAYRKHA